MPEWITRFWLEWIFGICIAILTGLWRSVSVKLKKARADNDAIKAGVQALLRAQMISDYNHYLEKGYAPIYAKQNFENCWVQYENLGENGVIQDIHQRFMQLPTVPPVRETAHEI